MRPISKALKNIYELVDSVILSAVVVLLLFTFVFKIFVVSGSSMNPTLNDMERIIVSDVLYTPKRGDIICFYADQKDEVLVKRVIATEGQVIDIRDGFVYVDNVKLDEEYIPTIPYTDVKVDTQPSSVIMPHTVEKGCVFVLGDNRFTGKSLDSRYVDIGDVNRNDIFGRLIFRLYHNFGKVE